MLILFVDDCDIVVKFLDHGFKNQTKAKTFFASSSRFLTGFEHFYRIGLVHGSRLNWLDQPVWSSF